MYYVEKRYLNFLEVTISEIMKKDYKLRIISAMYDIESGEVIFDDINK